MGSGLRHLDLILVLCVRHGPIIMTITPTKTTMYIIRFFSDTLHSFCYVMSSHQHLILNTILTTAFSR